MNSTAAVAVFSGSLARARRAVGVHAIGSGFFTSFSAIEPSGAPPNRRLDRYRQKTVLLHYRYAAEQRILIA